MIISSQDSNNSAGKNIKILSDEKLTTQKSLQDENSSIISASEDVLTLSASSLKAFFTSQAAALGKTILSKNIQSTTFIPTAENVPEVLSIAGSTNKIYDSAGNDLIYAKGSSNQFDSSQGNDELLLVGSKNKIKGYNNTVQAAIVGDTNQITITGSGALSATLNGSINKVTSDTGADFVLLNGKRNNISTGSGDDSILAYANAHLVYGGSGDDVIISTGQNFNISGGTGNDTISTDGNGRINGEGGNDIIEIKSTGNTVNGGDGNDTIIFYSALNTLNGDDGDDTFQVKLTEGNVTISGGKDTDTVKLDIKRSDYSAISSDSDVTFYLLSNHSKKLKISFKDIEKFQFSDNESLSISEIKDLKGLSYQINESKDKTTVTNKDLATNVFDLNVPVSNIIKATKTSLGSKITYKNLQNQQKTIQVQNFTYLKVADNLYVNLSQSPNFEYLDVTPSETYVISKEISSGRYQSKFYDQTSESLLLKKEYNEKDSNFLFKDGSFLTATELLSSFSGKSTDVTIDTTTVSPISPTTNTANLKFSSDKINRIDKTSADNYKLYFKKSDSETGTITFKNISFIVTEEGDQLSLAAIYKDSANIRKNEKSHPTYASDAQNTEFKRIAYNQTGNISYLESLIGGSYESLTDSQKSTLSENAAILENSITFTSDYSDKIVDESTKKLFTLRTANLLKNRSDVLQNLADAKVDVYFTKDQDLGGDSSGFTTGYASYSTTGNNTQYEIHYVLSAYYGGIFDGSDGDSVDLHEAMHIIDFRSLNEEGLPYGISSSTSATYIKERNLLFAKYKQTQTDVGAIREYGFTNNEEFLAVASESFYEKPDELKTTSALLYSSLAEYFEV